MDDDDHLTPDELEQLARSLAMDGSLGHRDAQRVAVALRELAQIRRTQRGWLAGRASASDRRSRDPAAPRDRRGTLVH